MVASAARISVASAPHASASSAPRRIVSRAFGSTGARGGLAEPHEQIGPLSVGSTERRRVVERLAEPADRFGRRQLGQCELARRGRPPLSLVEQPAELGVAGQLRGQLDRRCRLGGEHRLERLGVEGRGGPTAELRLERAGDERVGEADVARQRGVVGQDPGGHGATEQRGDLVVSQVGHRGQHPLVELHAEHRRGGEHRLGLRAEGGDAMPDEVAQCRRQLQSDRGYR